MERSETISEIGKALALFQAEVSNPGKNAVNPHFKSKYSTLDEIINVIRPTLTKHGLSFLQTTKNEGDLVGVSTMILHTSGEFLSSDYIWIPTGKNNAHGVGAAVTYGRRFSLGAMLGIATDEDMDGNGSLPDKKPQKNQQQQQPSGNPGQPTNLISEAQKKALNTLIGKVAESRNITRDDVLATLMKKPGIGQFESTTKLTKSQASKAIATLQEALGEAQ